MTFTILSIDGKTPVEKETLKISESWVKVSFLRRFSVLVGILLGPVDLFESREDMISYLSVGSRKKELSGLFLRKLEKCLWEYSIFSLVLAAMDVKKLLNMLYVLVVSLEARILGIFNWLLFIFKIDFIPFQVFLMLSQLVLK